MGVGVIASIEEVCGGENEKPEKITFSDQICAFCACAQHQHVSNNGTPMVP